MEKVLIPDEISMDYTKSEEEIKEEWEKRSEESDKAFKEIEKWKEK